MALLGVTDVVALETQALMLVALATITLRNRAYFVRGLCDFGV
jgi:hypothetical protein